MMFKYSSLNDGIEVDKKGFPIFKVLFVIFIVIQLFKYFSFDETVLKNVGMEPFSEPVQEMIAKGEPFELKLSNGKAYVTPIANYKIYGRVYAKHRSPQKMVAATMYPYDLGIFFGDFQYKEVYRNIKVQLVGKFLNWSYSGSAMQNHLYKYFKKDSMEHCFTYNHLCPANKNILKGIKKLQKKDVVYVEGYLIKYSLYKKDGSIEKGISSTTRNDNEPMMSGNNGYGSCEQIYVTRIVSRHGDFK